MRLSPFFLNGSARRGVSTPHGLSAETNKSGAGFCYPTPHIRHKLSTKMLANRGAFRYNERWCSNAVVWVVVHPHRDVRCLPTSHPAFYLSRVVL